MNKADWKVLKKGLKRLALSLFTAALFAVSVYGFVVTALVSGYVAVLLFVTSVVTTGSGFLFLYAHGLDGTEDQGESK
jgi:hypothetical protein